MWMCLCRSQPCTILHVVTATRAWRVEAGSVIDVISLLAGVHSGNNMLPQLNMHTIQ